MSANAATTGPGPEPLRARLHHGLDALTPDEVRTLWTILADVQHSESRIMGMAGDGRPLDAAARYAVLKKITRGW